MNLRVLLCAAGMEAGNASRKMIARGGHMAAVMDWLLPQHNPRSAMPEGWEAGASAEAGPSDQDGDPSAHPPPPQVAMRPDGLCPFALCWLACRHVTAPLLPLNVGVA